ncbi:MAG: hypothetical protein IJZ56_00195 [Oscillospiraceae bacterium]|nr:hypothetical protein [Oscillospiraceae bacterium]
MKKFLAIVLALAIVLGLCAACGGGGELNEKTNADGKVKVQIGLGTSAKVLDYENNSLTKWLEEQTGLEIEIVEYAGGTDVSTQISATISARQNLPDILYGVSLNEATINTYGEEGYFLNLRSYYEDTEGASKIFWDRMGECLTEYQQEYVLNKITDPDTGGMYGVPTVETSLVDGLDAMAWINTEWLDALNLEAPTDIDSLYNVLKAFRDNDCNGNGDKDDEIPLFGKSNVIGWILNMYIYYNEHHLFQDYNGDGKVEPVYTQDAYREGLAFVSKLYKEGLLTKLVYTASSSDCRSIITPNSGEAKVGIFIAHLTTQTTDGSEVLYQYQPLKGWGCATERDISASLRSFITETAKKRDVVDECFNLLMTMWSWDGSMRIRYGEYGVNWTDADEGAKSAYGLDATYKILDDPFAKQTDTMWGTAAGSLNHYAEGETAQIDENLNEWTKTKYHMHAQAREYFDWAMENINPQYITDPFLEIFLMTSKEEESISMNKTNVNNVISTYTKNFVTNDKGMDINNPAHWQEYLNALKTEGIDDIQAMYQKCYERQK